MSLWALESMDAIARWGRITTIVALLAVGVAGVPAVVIDASSAPVAAYYTAGVGLWSTAALALVTAVAAWAVDHGHSDPATAVGATAAVAVATLVTTILWATGVSQTLIFSFPASVAWIELHRPGMLVMAGVLTVAALRLSTLIVGTGR